MVKVITGKILKLKRKQTCLCSVPSGEKGVGKSDLRKWGS